MSGLSVECFTPVMAGVVDADVDDFSLPFVDGDGDGDGVVMVGINLVVSFTLPMVGAIEAGSASKSC